MAEFKLGRLRFVWQGTWTTGTSYVKDDIVRNSGKTYVCTIAHTASANFVTDLSAIPTKWNQVSDGSTWTGNWTINTYYNVNDIVKYGGIVYICNTAHTSSNSANSGQSPDTSAGLEANLSNWTVYATSFNWLGNWASLYRYKANDVVKYGGETYICNTGHQSSASTTTLSVSSATATGGTATLTFASTQSIAPYSAGTTLTVSNFSTTQFNGTFTVLACTTTYVTYALGGSYTGTTGTISANGTKGLENDQSKWTVFADGFTWTVDWLTSTAYRVNDVVRYGGYLYVCNTAHTSASSATSGLEANQSYWDYLHKGFNYLGLWSSSSVRYKANDIVLYGADTYICTTPHTSYSTFVETNWSKFVEGLTYFNTWNSSTTYQNGDLVTYGGFSYIAASQNSGVVPTTDVSSPNTITITAASTVGNTVTLTYATQGSVPFTANQTITVANVVPSSYNGTWVVTGTPTTTQVSYTIPNGPLSAATGFGTVAANNWFLYTTGWTLLGDWTTSPTGLQTGQTGYRVGNVVRNGAYTYVCILDHTPSSGNQPPNTTYWSRLNTGVRFNAPGATYTGLSTTNVTVTNGSAAGAQFTVTSTGTVYSLNKTANGTNYTAGDIIKILGTSVGGISPFNDITITVGTVTGGAITTYSFIGYSSTWITSTAYVAGDITVYGPNSYVCILAHTASSLNSPPNDLTGTYWNLIAAGASTSILTTSGDIAYYGPTGATRLGIGSVGQVLKVSAGGLPSWGYFGLISDVYYVSNTNGVDSPAPNYGQTLDRPWKTIKYACQQVLNGTYYPNTSYLLTQNKNWAIAEMYNWMIYEKTNSISPFSPSSSYDQYKTQRDAGYIVDAVIYDLVRGGNSQTVAAALAFFQQGSTSTFITTNVASQAALYIAALNKLSNLLTTNVIANTAPGTIYQNTTGGSGAVTSLTITGASGLNGLVTFTFATQTNSPFVIGETITISGVSPSGFNGSFKVISLSTSSVTVASLTTATYSSGGSIAGSVINQTIDTNYVAEAGASANITSLISIITTALTNVSTASIPSANAGVTSTIFIKNGTYNEVLPISVPENVALVGDELRGVIVQPLSTTAPFTGSTSAGTLTVSAMTNILSNISITSTSISTYGSTGTGGYLTVANTTGLLTGHQFVITGAGGGGISAGTYFVGQVLSATTLTLATSYTNALAGTYITLTSSNPTSTTFTATGNIIVGMYLTGNSAILSPVQITAQLTGASGSSATSQTFNGTSGSYNITLSSANASVVVGMFVSGNGATISGIPTNTFVTAVNGTTVTLSNELTTSFTGNTTTAYFFYAGKAGTYTIYNTGSDALLSAASSLSISSTSLTAGYLTGNMFYCRNGSGVRNMTLYGLTGSVGTPVAISTGSITATTVATYGTTNTGGTITVGSTTGMATGNQFIVAGTGGGGLTAGTYYIGSVLTTTTLTLSTTYNNAIAGTYIAFTGASLSGTTYSSNYGTSRPTAGAYTSLDPGVGPQDTSVWIFRKSPYVQNVTTFGTGCVGLKIDGTLHNGGNRSIVCNDFTQVLSDGIGVWAYGTNALTECVSVFSYYNQIGYLAEAGAKIRATNGNSSYGSYGVVAEGYDLTETPVTATVNNRYTYPIIANVLTDAVNRVWRLEFTNAGQTANTATFNIASSGGYNVATVGNEFRDNAVFETRYLTGGANYVIISNVGQAGTLYQITIAATDTNISGVYVGERIVLIGGTGGGQTGYITNYNNGSKIAQIAKETIPTLPISATTTATSSATGVIIAVGITNIPAVFVPISAVTGSAFAPGMFLTSSGTITAGTYISATSTGAIGTSSLASSVVSTTGTIGSITGAGPWTATITGMSSTSSCVVGMPLTATSGTGTLYGGSPTSVVVTSIVSQTSITYTVTGGTTPTAGTVTNISSTLLSATVSASNLMTGGLLSGGSVTNYTYITGQINATGSTAQATCTITGTSGQSTLTLSSFTVGSIGTIAPAMFITPISGLPANTFVTAINFNALTVTLSQPLVGAVSGTTSFYIPGGLGTYSLNQAATGTPTATANYIVSANQTRASATITGTQNTITVSSTAGMYNGMPFYLSATTGTNLNTATLYYAVGVTTTATTAVGMTTFTNSVFSAASSSNATAGLAVTTTTSQSITWYPAGWDHVVTGWPLLANLDVTTNYIIEPRVTFTSPGFTSVLGTQTSGTWIDCAYGDINGTYSSIGVTGGSGTGAQFNITRTGIAYSVTLATGGIGYAIGNTLTIAGANLGGTTPTNNITITVTNTVGGIINNFTYSGQGAGGNFVAIANAGTSTMYSTTGSGWNAGGALPASSTWSAVAYGANGSVGTWVAVANGSNTGAISTNGGVTWTASGTLGLTTNWSAIAYGGSSQFIAIQYGGSSVIISTNGGSSWTTGAALPQTANWTSIAFGGATWVAIASGGTTSAYSTNPTVGWLASNGLPSSQNWTSVAFGKNKFVAIAANTSATAYSFDGITWYAGLGLPSTQTWNKVRYAQGLFMATNTDAGSTTCATSEDGIYWTSRTLSTTASAGVVAFGNPNSVPYWVVLTYGTTGYNLITTGCTAQARVTVAGGAVTSFKMIEPGSGYASTPAVTIIDPNQTTSATWSVRTGTGAIANPTFTNRGLAYATASATVVTNGIADIYQPGTYINVAGIYTTPVAGSNIIFNGNSTIYKLVQVTNLIGTGGGLYPYTAQFQINPSLTTTNAPANGTAITLRIKYSQVRLTGHDFLSIGTGNFTNTNYPGTPLLVANGNYQTVSNNGGRVFFTSTDQDGNFNVGNLFSVQQATGTATLNASAFNVAGLNSLTIGSVSLGNNSATITSFSTDPYFTANSDNILPTQKAIKSYISSQIGGGGSSLNVNTLTAGSIYIAGNSISTTTQVQIKVANKMYFIAGVDGSPLAVNFLLN